MKSKEFKLGNNYISFSTIRVWGQFFITPTIVTTTTTQLLGYHSIEIGWGKWFLAIDIIPTDFKHYD
jgi:hypothetical protein